MAKFIRAQSPLLLERLDQLDLDEAAGQCERLHEQAEMLYRTLSVHLDEQEALAGCRGAVLTRVFVMPARVRYYKCTSCPGVDTKRQPQKKPGEPPGR